MFRALEQLKSSYIMRNKNFQNDLYLPKFNYVLVNLKENIKVPFLI